MAARCLICLVLTLVLLVPAIPIVAQQEGPPQQPTAPPSVVVINGQAIPQTHLDRYINQKWGRQVLEDLVDSFLVRQEAAAQGVGCSEAEIDERVKAVKAEMGSVEAFNQMLRDRGLTHWMYRSEVKTDILIEKLMAREFAVSDEEAQAYCEAHPAEFSAPPKVHLFDIVTATAQEAYTARQRIADGEDFSAVAQALSVDPTGELGGDRGWLLKEDINNALVREVAFSLQEGQVSNPIKVGETYHVLYAAEVQAGKDISFEQARDDIIKRLRAERSVPREVYILTLRRKADIKVAWEPYAYMTQEYAKLRTIRVAVDDKLLSLPAAPVILPSGRMLVPAKAVLQEIGAAISWVAATQTMRAQTIAGKVEVTVGSMMARVGEAERDMGAAPEMRDGTLWIPPRVVVEALGGKVQWDKHRNTLFITSPAALAEQAAGPQ